MEANRKGISADCSIFLKQMHNKQCLTLKNNDKVMKYANNNGPIRWKIRTSKKVIHIFDSSHRSHDIYISNFVTLKMLVKVMTYNICSGAMRWQKPDFLSDGKCNGCIFAIDTCYNSQLKSLTL